MAPLISLFILLVGCGGSSESVAPIEQPAIDTTPEPASSRWVGAWGAAPHMSTAQANRSFRMIVAPLLGGEMLRIRLSNAYGDTAAFYETVRIAQRTDGPAVDAATSTLVTFNGMPSVTVPADGEVVSDPMAFPVAFGDEIAVSFFIPADAPLGTHGNAWGINYFSDVGADVTDEANGASYTNTSQSWLGFMGLDVLSSTAPGTLVALGDSITDGNNPPETNNRWPDYFAQILNDAGVDMGVLNEGIGANQVTQDTNFLGMSEAAVTRFTRDVLGRPAVSTLVLFEGTNDLAQGITGAAVFDGLTTIARAARQQGIHVIVSTVTPRGRDATWAATPSFETERQALNGMIRNAIGTEFDVLADFAQALASPLDSTIMAPEFDSGDGLHPNPVGLQEIANTIELTDLQ